MTPTLKAMVEAMVAELVRQSTAKELVPMHAADVSRRDGADGRYGTGDVSSIYLMGRFDLEKVARAGLAAIPAEELAVAISAALKPGEFYVFGTTDGVDAGKREVLDSVGIDGTGDLIETARTALLALISGVEWRPNATGALVAYLPDAILGEKP